MNTEERTTQWLTETERVIQMIRQDFTGLSESQLSYTVHVNRCNIWQIMIHVANYNARLYAGIVNALPRVQTIGTQQEYKPDWVEKLIFERVPLTRCIARKISGQAAPIDSLQIDLIFQEILDQQYKLKELIEKCKTLDINKRVVPFWLFGLIRLSLAGAIDNLILNQKHQFIKARHILMLQ